VKKQKGLSIILPVYNGEKYLENSVKSILNYAKKRKIKVQLIIVEDGSTDNSYEIAKKLKNNYMEITLLHSRDRLGKGLAIKKGFFLSKYEKIVFTDVDLSAELKSIFNFAEKLEKYDLIIGIRYFNKKAKHSFLRLILGLGYIYFINFLFGKHYLDYQCGLKAFRKSKMMEVFANLKDNGWFFDTELILLSEKYKKKILQIPIVWEHRRSSSIKKLGFLKLIFNLFISAIKFRLREG